MRKLAQATLKLICRLKGCDYRTSVFSLHKLNYCQRCGEEIAGRTIADLEPIAREDWQAWYLDHFAIYEKEPEKMNRLYLAIKYWCQLNYSWRLAWVAAQR